MLSPKKSGPDEYEIVDLQDGRIALKRGGLVIFVGRSHAECTAELRRRVVYKKGLEEQAQYLHRAIGRMK